MPKLVALFVLLSPWSVLAQPSALGTAPIDAPAPSLSLPSDPDRPIYRFATYIDPVGLFLDGYGLSVVACPSRFLSVTLSPFGARAEGGTLGLELALTVRPFGRGVHGLGVGIGAGAVMMREDDGRELRVFGELGYTHVLGGFFLGGSAGLGVSFEDGARALAPRVRAVLGFAFR